jgi:hypothetical protein
MPIFSSLFWHTFKSYVHLRVVSCWQLMFSRLIRVIEHLEVNPILSLVSKVYWIWKHGILTWRLWMCVQSIFIFVICCELCRAPSVFRWKMKYTYQGPAFLLCQYYETLWNQVCGRSALQLHTYMHPPRQVVSMDWKSVTCAIETSSGKNNFHFDKLLLLPTVISTASPIFDSDVN